VNQIPAALESSSQVTTTTGSRDRPSFSPRHKAIHEAMGRETSAAVRALLRCARQVSPEPPSARGLGAWPAAARGNPPCLARRGAHRGARSASRAWASALVQTTPQRPYARVDPDPAPSFALRGSAHVTARNASGRGRGGSDEPSRTTPEHRVNDQITARQVRLVIDREFDGASSSDTPDSNDTQQTKTHEVLSVLVALRRAKQLGLDLVEVNARADPPVCRLMRYDSFRYARKQKERDGRRAAVERRRADTVKELKLTARISPNDMRVKADKAQKFFASGHKVTLRVEFKTNDGVKQSLRPRAGELLFREFQSILIDTFDAAHVVVQEGKMVGPNHMTVTLAPESQKKGKTGKKGKTERPSEAPRMEMETRVVEDREAVSAAEVAAQGDVVRALKARRGAGDDAVQQKDVDDAVAHLLRLKARAGVKSPQEGAENPAADRVMTDRTKTSNENVRKRLSSVAAAEARARGFASGSRSVFSRSFVSSAPALGSRSAHGRAGERVGAAKARAKALKNASKRSSDAPPTKSRESRSLEALDEARGDEAGSVASERSRFKRLEDVEKFSKFSNRDPSSFRLGAAAEEHVAYAREEARVAAVLAARREERAKAQARVDGEAEAERDSRRDESGAGAWAGAAAAATLAAAVAATLAATAASELTLVPRAAFDDESRSESRSEPTTRVGQTRESKNDAISLKIKSARLHPALDAAVAFAGGAGVVVSALGWPPGR